MPALTGVLETCLYVDDLDRSSRFYENVFGLTQMMGDDRIRAYGIGERSVLLLFKRGASNFFTEGPSGGTLGPHDGNGPLHFAFAIAAEDLTAWEDILNRHEIQIETRIHWPRGGTSLYFRDPDNNLGELATPGVWATY
jgi:catechol 2,3-dioxygenase-like lactoylglutathione lyase family enzyme